MEPIILPDEDATGGQVHNNINPAGTDHKKGCGALYAASLWRSPTSKADPHHRHRGFSSTGTNISYEGHTDPGVGPGSAER